MDNKILYICIKSTWVLVGIGDTIAEAEEICENVTKYVKGDVYHRRDVGTADLIQKRIKHMESIRN